MTEDRNAKRTAALILAAGTSSRMGTAKALLPLGKKSMIQRLTDTVLLAGADLVVIVTGYAAQELQHEVSDRDVVFVHNHKYAESEMIDSIQLGLTAVRDHCGKALICPVDTPLAQVDTIKKIMEADGDFICPSFHYHAGHPVALHQNRFDEILRYRGNGGLKGAIHSSGIRTTYIPVNDEGVILSSNTPEEYIKMLSFIKNDPRIPAC